MTSLPKITALISPPQATSYYFHQEPNFRIRLSNHEEQAFNISDVFGAKIVNGRELRILHFPLSPEDCAEKCFGPKLKYNKMRKRIYQSPEELKKHSPLYRVSSDLDIEEVRNLICEWTLYNRNIQEATKNKAPSPSEESELSTAADSSSNSSSANDDENIDINNSSNSDGRTNEPATSAVNTISTQSDLFETVDSSNCAQESSNNFGMMVPHYLVIVNPNSGKGKALESWKTQVKPLWDFLGSKILTYDCIKTKRENACFEYFKNPGNLKYTNNNYSAIVILSGDGLIYETVNGILENKDFSDSSNNNSILPIAHLPGGSGNGLVSSIFYEKDNAKALKREELDFGEEGPDLISAALACAKFELVPFDLWDVSYQKYGENHGYSLESTNADITNSDETAINVGNVDAKVASVTPLFKTVAALTITWNLISDIDIESEKVRWMGSFRFDFYGAIRWFKRRKYFGKLSWAVDFDENGFPPQMSGNNQHQGNIADINTSKKTNNVPFEPDLSKPVPSSWQSYSGPISFFLAANIPKIARNTYANKHAKCADGFIHLILVKKCSRMQLAKLLLALETGDYIDFDFVEVIKCKAFRLEPVRYSKKRNGYIVVDGEKLDDDKFGSVQAKVRDQGMRVVSAGRSRDVIASFLESN